MIVCSCNIITDGKIRDCIRSTANPTVGMVFKSLGCKPDCATCVQTIVRLINEHNESIEKLDN